MTSSHTWGIGPGLGYYFGSSNRLYPFVTAGRPERALAIIRRQWMQSGEERAYLLPARLLLRARLAAQLGFTDEAIQSCRHYLTLRSNPEPPMADQNAEVRKELAAPLGKGAPRS